jgi:hypothetical protein
MQKQLIVSATQLIGCKLLDNQSNPIGSIKEFMIDDVTGNIIYAIVAIHACKQLSNTLLPIPFNLCLFEPGTNTLQLKFNIEQLQTAPCFNPQQWPDFTNEHWQKQIQTFYQTMNTNTPINKPESATI